MLFRELFSYHAQVMQNKIVAYKYEFGEFEGVSCEKFHEDCYRAEAFWARESGDKRVRIAMVAENSYTYLVQLFGIILSGNTAVPINQNLSRNDLTGFIKELKIDMVAADEDWAEELAQLNVLSKDKIFNIEETSCNLKEGGKSKSVGEDDLSVILLSSGTSGKSKAVHISQRNLTISSKRISFENRDCSEKVMQVIPIYHIGGIILSIEELMRGNAILISNAKYYLIQFANFAFDKLLLVPAMAQNLFNKAPDREDINEGLNNVKSMLCVGAPLLAETVTRMRARNIKPIVYYGLTEATGTISGDGEYKDGACGKICPHNEVKIVDGEILVRGENVTSGYINNDEATRELLKGGWLHTGDLGKIDEDGYLFIIGRSKNIIILSNGENVSPEELESKLYECGEIEETMVFGENDTVCAKIYCGRDSNGEKENTVREFIRNMNRSLPTTKKIKEIIFVNEELPKSGVGKIKR